MTLNTKGWSPDLVIKQEEREFLTLHTISSLCNHMQQASHHATSRCGFESEPHAKKAEWHCSCRTTIPMGRTNDVSKARLTILLTILESSTLKSR